MVSLFFNTIIMQLGGVFVNQILHINNVLSRSSGAHTGGCIQVDSTPADYNSTAILE